MTAKLAFMQNEVQETYKFRWVVHSFVAATLRMRYRRSVLGFFWSLLGPLLNYLVMGLILSKVARFTNENYIAYMLFGSITFNFINASMVQSGSSLIGNEHYIRKVYLPKLVFPLSAVLMEGVNTLLGLLALIIVVGFLGDLNVSVAVLTLPLSLLLLLMFVLGLGCILSVAFVYFRDLAHVVPILMQVAFFSTPIIYPVSAIPAEYMFLLKWNPFYHFVEIIRAPFVEGHLNWNQFIFCTVLAVASLGFGLRVLKKFDNKVVFKL